MKLKLEHRFLIYYVVFGGLWILLSDKALLLLFSDLGTLSRIQTFKGWFFVLVTGLLIFWYLRSHIVKLREAEQKAKSSDELKTAFIQNISHEIRTPLNGINGFGNLLIQTIDPKDERSQTYLNMILVSSDRLLKIINNVLEISKLDSEKLIVHQTKFTVVSVMQELHEHFKLFKPDKVRMSVQVDSGCEKISCYSDEEKLKRVLSNLLDNALKFTNEGEVVLGLTMHNDKLDIYVKDTGIGVNSEVERIMYDRFRQGDQNLNRDYGGTGLGLAISKELCGYLDATLQYEANYDGKGSVFHVLLPYKKT